MTIVWPTELDVDAYVAAGRELEVPRPNCPGCHQPMRFWGWYERDVRLSAEVVHRLSVRRARCCDRTHALLPGFLVWGRLDAVEVIGQAIEAMCRGTSMGALSTASGAGHTTVRNWRRRFVQRAELLAVGFVRYCVALGDLAPRLSGTPEAVALSAARAAWASARRRFGAEVGVLWRCVNAVIGGHLISTNTDPPWAAS